MYVTIARRVLSPGRLQEPVKASSSVPGPGGCIRSMLFPGAANGKAGLCSSCGKASPQWPSFAPRRRFSRISAGIKSRKVPSRVFPKPARIGTQPTRPQGIRYGLPSQEASGRDRSAPRGVGQSRFGSFRQGTQTFIAGWSSPVARQAHNLKVIGSNPIPATKFPVNSTSWRGFCFEPWPRWQTAREGYRARAASVEKGRVKSWKRSTALLWAMSLCRLRSQTHPHPQPKIKHVT
jgi:hypothetical protein